MPAETAPGSSGAIDRYEGVGVMAKHEGPPPPNSPAPTAYRFGAGRIPPTSAGVQIVVKLRELQLASPSHAEHRDTT
ncbi:hypothetical protein ACIPWY_34295 [Streptomyces sp. NPDC090032]|uniref:hypothetical protein n=1 Tax=unclassified Streptomyces TaxID=2593676 RepID=UPI00371B29F3